MATTPTTPDLQQQLVAEFSALAHKHATVSYVLIGVLVLVLAVVGLGGWLGLKSYEAQIARAEASEAQYNQDRKEWQATLEAHDAQREQDSLAEAQIIAQAAKRDAQPVPQPIQAGLTPVATSQATAIALGAAYGGQVAPKVTPDDQVSISQPDAKLVITDKLAGDKAAADLADQVKINSLKVTENNSLTSDLNQCKQQNAEAGKVIAQYKKAAVKSKWRKMLDGSEKAALLVAGAALGHYL
jgi:hypothetical protein